MNVNKLMQASSADFEDADDLLGFSVLTIDRANMSTKQLRCLAWLGARSEGDERTLDDFKKLPFGELVELANRVFDEAGDEDAAAPLGESD